MDFLPTEVLAEILSLVLRADTCPSPSSIFLTCSTFRNVGSKQLYSHLRFKTSGQLYSFLGYYGANAIEPTSVLNPNSTPSSSVSIPYPPRTMEFCLSNDLKIITCHLLSYHHHSRLIFELRTISPRTDPFPPYACSELSELAIQL